MFTLDEMQMKTAFTPFTLDESSATHIQSAKCKFVLRSLRKELKATDMQQLDIIVFTRRL
jgi:hypothetical protein